LGKQTFREFEKKFLRNKFMKDLVKVVYVICEGGAIDQYVVEEDNDEFAEVRAKQFIHG
jgi:hypothetical protein